MLKDKTSANKVWNRV